MKNLSISFFLSPTRDDFNIKVLQAFVELHEFADLNLVQALRSEEREYLSKGYNKYNGITVWSWHLYVAGSSCGVSACQVKLRRSTVWWRRLPHVTANATPGSSSRQVRTTNLVTVFHTIHHFVIAIYLLFIICYKYIFWGRNLGQVAQVENRSLYLFEQSVKSIMLDKVSALTSSLA